VTITLGAFLGSCSFCLGSGAIAGFLLALSLHDRRAKRDLSRDLHYHNVRGFRPASPGNATVHEVPYEGEVS
jgi:hypothetical protein